MKAIAKICVFFLTVNFVNSYFFSAYVLLPYARIIKKRHMLVLLLGVYKNVIVQFVVFWNFVYIYHAYKAFKILYC